MPPFDYTPPPYTGPSAAEILAKRKEFLSCSMFHFNKKPLNLVHGKMQYLFDEDGRRYLNAFGGIATVSCGHCQPDVVNAVVTQTDRLQHSTILYLNHAIADFTQGPSLEAAWRTQSTYICKLVLHWHDHGQGTEANELPLMMARLYTGCQDVISIRNACHGNAAGTMGTTAQSNWKFNVVRSGVHHALNPDPYQGVFGADGEKYAKDGVVGIIELAPGYLPLVYSSIRKAGGLCIADEVQSAFARTGSHFWGFQAHGVISQHRYHGQGNGIPIGAVVTAPQIAEVLTRRSYFNTFGGNPVCTAAGHAVLPVIEKENLQENSHVIGSHLKKKMKFLI
ncbi:hypothetical protein CRG98_043682 [Punica granatum]|uniref:Uncharacterized protein n=1 Tax=Punica granatum TaxID=22663 RepID=A0A2I0HW66_PUNGR|nr:hypothetical protein CRG98_043682 [Punica granatum]